MDKLASEYKVLIVDDVPTNVMLVQAILKKEGYTLLTCDSGTKALRIANEKHPNLILLDIMMPEMDGYEVLQHLKSNPETTDIPVIIMSALSDMQSIVKGYQLGATEYVTKPFQREELVKRVAHRYELYSIKRIKAELENTIESRDTLYSVIAHDLRSPLTTITGSADLLPGEKDGRRKAKYVENIRHTSEYILSLVDTLMDFYLLDTGQAQSYERIFHLESLFKETVDNYAPLAQRKRLLLSSGFSGTDVVVCGDKSHLQQIVNNLLSNALKFTKEGSVRLEAEYRNGELHLCVRDTGTGMDEKDAERIFTAFERLENARGVSGFGLGLAICSRQVSRMGSSIRVESSCFSFRRPTGNPPWIRKNSPSTFIWKGHASLCWMTTSGSLAS